MNEKKLKEWLLLEGLRYHILLKFDLFFNMQNPYKQKFKCTETEALHKAKWNYIQKNRSSIILCNDYSILLEIRKMLNSKDIFLE